MKNLILIILVLFSFGSQAQIKKVSIQASGLTCSMCSNAINKALRSLDFVADVNANIKNSTFDVSFKPGSNIDFDRLKKKVEDAGFFVARFTASVHFDGVAVVNDNHVLIGNTVFHFLNVKNQVLNGDQMIRLLDKGYVTVKEYKRNGSFTKMECYKTGVAGSCCAKDGLPAGKRIFHVTI